jgi:hypothetical protein
MSHIRVIAQFDVDVDPPEGETAADYAMRCLVAYFNHHPHQRIQAHGKDWQKIRAVAP